MQILLFEDIMVAEGKQAYIKNGVETTCSRVTEGLKRDVFFKRAVKKIDAG